MLSSYPKKYFGNLDATRFLSCLTVFLHHTIITGNKGTSTSALYRFYDTNLSPDFIIGLDYYVVLSGFLISWVILEEYQLTLGFKLGFYYLRRILRTWPLYLLLILLGYILIMTARHFSGTNVHDLPPASWLLSFTLNFYIIKHGMEFLFFIAFLWSICVEEQLYALWGILLKWGKRFFEPICVLLVIASLLFRITHVHDGYNLFFNTINWIANFAIGGLMASFCIKGGKLFEKIKRTPKPVIALIYFLFIINVAFYKYIYSTDIMVALERIIITLFFSFLIFEQSFCNNHLFQLGKSKVMSYLGKIAYGLFCFHGPITLLFGKVAEHINWPNSDLTVFLINPLIIFAVTAAVSAASYKYFEKPIMSLRHKYQTA